MDLSPLSLPIEDKHRFVQDRIKSCLPYIDGAVLRFCERDNALEDEQRVLYALRIFVHYLNEETMGEKLPRMVNNLHTHRPVEEDIKERGTVHDIGLLI